ncbi:MAG: hypothetical protein IPJ27_10415 [Candidatus Accumulibacter sp.]|uniref:Uncharacterized protein n=1 Tax=Candidatus Accumulibacter proximus TaxID=2954385 RepID=A0A935UH43_9PROT|nr:hypothetical protein [Candidatus Accumulibacter proximus]
MVTAAIYQALQVYGIAIVISLLVAVVIKVHGVPDRPDRKSQAGGYADRNGVPDRTGRS